MWSTVVIHRNRPPRRVSPNESRQPTPVERSRFCCASAARRARIHPLGQPAPRRNMNVVPPAHRVKQVCFTTRPKALIATAISALWFLIGIVTWSLGCPMVAAISVFSVQMVLLITTVCFWRFERPREIQLKGDLPEPPVMHGS